MLLSTQWTDGRASFQWQFPKIIQCANDNIKQSLVYILEPVVCGISAVNLGFRTCLHRQFSVLLYKAEDQERGSRQERNKGNRKWHLKNGQYHVINRSTQAYLDATSSTIIQRDIAIIPRDWLKRNNLSFVCPSTASRRLDHGDSSPLFPFPGYYPVDLLRIRPTPSPRPTPPRRDSQSNVLAF